MASTRELRLRVRSIKNLAQVTKALETVSASYVRKAIAATQATRPYAEKAWDLLQHLACQPGHASLHPLLAPRSAASSSLIVMISGDRGLAGPYNVNILRTTLAHEAQLEGKVSYVTVGRKGRDLLVRRRKDVIAEFSHLPVPPSFMDVSAIGQLVIEEYQNRRFDNVFIAYTDFHSMAHQEPVFRQILPLDAQCDEEVLRSRSVYTYEPDPEELLDEIVPRFTAIQIYQAILSSQASEYAARMVAMRNATDSANELIGALELEYNKLRQQLITNEMLDISGGANALAENG
ncbi:MAG: ATP synthase F1 subunit gamma [Chloroflexi bacterium]|nr:ATP synthase F1 subunit gamma [Chloroflexota bacterium]